MSVLLETSLGDLTIDLLTADAPLTSKNFLKLCKLKHYNDSLFYRVEKGFIAVVGHASSVHDPANAGSGPTAWGLAEKLKPGSVKGKEDERYLDYIPNEINRKRKHDVIGVVATANEIYGKNGSTFYITLGTDLSSLDFKHTIFGYVVEGQEDILANKMNEVLCDDRNAPLQPMRIRHTLILDDPYEDPEWILSIYPPKSPPPISDKVFEAIETVEDEVRLLERIGQNEARSRAIALEILGDIPDADMKPPDNVLFICKLNPYTEQEDLETIFSQFGTIVSCNIIRDWKTGDSLLYGFIEFEDRKSCENAYFKMQDALIDDRRVHVDFCQSVSAQYFAFKKNGNLATRQDAVDIFNDVDRFYRRRPVSDSRNNNTSNLPDTSSQRDRQPASSTRRSQVDERDRHDNLVPYERREKTRHYEEKRDRYRTSEDRSLTNRNNPRVEPHDRSTRVGPYDRDRARYER